MLRKIVLVMNMEVDEVYHIRNLTNRGVNNEFIHFCIEDSYVRERALKNLIHNNVDPKIIEAFKKIDLQTVFDSVKEEELSEFIEMMCKGINDIIYTKFEATTFKDHDLDGTVVLPVVYSGNRPFVEHTYVGWITPFDITHMLEHEKISEDVANKVQKNYGVMLRKHKDEFDVFFDGSSIQEVLEYLND